jgi:hypothetical protein
MFGDVTPNLSIRVRRILNERSMALLDSLVKNANTSALEAFILMFCEFSLVAKNGASGAPGLTF